MSLRPLLTKHVSSLPRRLVSTPRPTQAFLSFSPACHPHTTRAVSTTSKRMTTHGAPLKDNASDVPREVTEHAGYSAAETDAYLFSKLAPPNDLANEPSLVESAQRAKDAGLPDIAVSPLQGQFLSILVKGMGASKVLEIGTLWGFSTYFLTRALPTYGQIDTLEISPKHAEVAARTFLEADIYPFPKIYVGAALDTLKTLEPPGAAEQAPDAGYDLVFIDADKENIAAYFQESLRLTRKGGLIVVDNAVRRGRIVEDQTDGGVDVAGLRKLYDWIENDQGRTVVASGLQTVGTKGWDGFIIATKL